MCICGVTAASTATKNVHSVLYVVKTVHFKMDQVHLRHFAAFVLIIAIVVHVASDVVYC